MALYKKGWKHCTLAQARGIRNAAKAAKARRRERAWYERESGYDAIRAALRKDMPCMDCGVQYPPYVMDFHHTRGHKLFALSALSNGTLKDLAASDKLAAIRAEIAKCDLVCANCHREREHRKHNPLGPQGNAAQTAAKKSPNLPAPPRI